MKKLLILFALTTTFHGQVWFKVALDGNTIGVPTGTIMRYGATAGTPYSCGTGPTLTTTVWVTPTNSSPSVVSPIGMGVPDPAHCYIKELDVQQTTSQQKITVNGRNVTVPAGKPQPVGTITISYPLNCTGTFDPTTGTATLQLVASTTQSTSAIPCTAIVDPVAQTITLQLTPVPLK